MLVECVGEEWRDRVLAISRRAEVYWEEEVVVRWGTGGKKVMPGGEQWGRWCKEGQGDMGAVEEVRRQLTGRRVVGVQPREKRRREEQGEVGSRWEEGDARGGAVGQVVQGGAGGHGSGGGGEEAADWEEGGGGTAQGEEAEGGAGEGGEGSPRGGGQAAEVRGGGEQGGDVE